MAYKKKGFLAVVLSIIQAAAADLIFAGGKLLFNDGLKDLSEKLRVADMTSVVKKAYSAGVASVKTYDFTGIALLATSPYRFVVNVPGRIDFPGGGQEANELNAIREYVFYSGITAPTAQDVAQQFADRITADPRARVSATAAAGVLTLTLLDVNEGDFRAEFPDSTVETVTTAFVEPAGTPFIVNIEAGEGSAAPAGEYATWEISINKLYSHNAISGLKAYKPEVLVVFADINDANFAAFEAELDAILDGTHAPVTDYLGV